MIEFVFFFLSFFSVWTQWFLSRRRSTAPPLEGLRANRSTPDLFSHQNEDRRQSELLLFFCIYFELGSIPQSSSSSPLLTQPENTLAVHQSRVSVFERSSLRWLTSLYCRKYWRHEFESVPWLKNSSQISKSGLLKILLTPFYEIVTLSICWKSVNDVVISGFSTLNQQIIDDLMTMLVAADCCSFSSARWCIQGHRA